MKRFFGFALMLALLATPVFAANKTPKVPTTTIPMTVLVGSTKVPAGAYKVTWTGTGSDVQVTLAQKNKVIVMFAAKAVAEQNNVGVTTEQKGNLLVLRAIQLSNVNLVLEDTPHVGQQ